MARSSQCTFNTYPLPLAAQPVKESSRNSELFGIMEKKRTGGEKNGTVATG